ncbi:MAG: alanine--tRNA ligase [Pirellulales bacterium]|nr:alanine--tRNA ligase [Pirellulales bacterium]
MKTDELRERYLSFFESKGCTRRDSDVLVPKWDPSVLFTPAGMNQFKDHFLGRCELEFTRATTCQKCLRTGDIENVGRTAYHHTFFEMLGNFSFGDYFKREAIHWAWEFLTSKEWLNLPPEQLSVTVYLDDDEAYNIWADEIKVPHERIERMGEDDNFWPASAPTQGPDGVCGPCSEIFFHPPGSSSVEIWNLVFTQFNREGAPPDNLKPLPMQNIDTGMGLERTAATLQGVETNFHIDILKPIVLAAAEVCGVKYDPDHENGRRLRRITDHVRACAFAVHENVYPGSQKEKYVIKRLLRRAVLDGHQMGMRDPFLHKLVPAVVEMMRTPYPELSETVERVGQVIAKEETDFLSKLDDALVKIDLLFEKMRTENREQIAGGEAGDLYTTYGVPPELLQSLSSEHNLTIDWDAYRKWMDEHGKASGAGQKNLFSTGGIAALKETLHNTEFLGYESTSESASIKGIVVNEQLVDAIDEISHEHSLILVLDRSPFYGESGGQVGDVGEIVADGVRFEVTDTQKDGGLILHMGHLKEGKLELNQPITATVDATRRQGIRRAHSATHILHYALQKHLGEHAQQQGSKVDDDWLRFDFTNLEPVSTSQLTAIEQEIRTHIGGKSAIRWETLPLTDARKQGAMMLFGEKYPDPVRMVSIGEFSKELCGGTHLDNSTEVGEFELLSEEGISSGVRRIVALTGDKAKQHAKIVDDALTRTAGLLACDEAGVPSAVEAVIDRVRALKKQLTTGVKGEVLGNGKSKSSNSGKLDHRGRREVMTAAAHTLNVAVADVPGRVEQLLAEVNKLQTQASAAADSPQLSADDLIAGAEDISGARMIVADAGTAHPNQMRQWIDQVRKKVSPVAVMLVGKQGEKAMLVAGVTDDLIERGANAGQWVGETAKIVGGGGGGRPNMAQAGGKDPAKIPEALEKAREVMRAVLGA